MNRPTISPRGQARGVQRRFPGPGRGWAGAGLGLLLLGIAASASAESWRFEAEGLDPARRHDAGGNPFAIVACSSASGRQALEGLDASGDWVELPVTFERDVCLLDSLRCASPSGITWQFYVEFRPQGSEQIAASDEHDAVPGRGLTWTSSTYGWVQSSNSYCLPAGAYDMRVTRIGDGRTRLDLIILREVSLPVEPSTWGRIKALFAGP